MIVELQDNVRIYAERGCYCLGVGVFLPNNRSMGRIERQQLREIIDEVLPWVEQANSLLEHRAEVDKCARHAVEVLRRAVVDIRCDDEVQWRVLPFIARDTQFLTDVAQKSNQPEVTTDEHWALDRIAREGSEALDDVRFVVGARRFFSRGKQRAAGKAAANSLTQLHSWGIAKDAPQLLERLDQRVETVPDVSPAEALDDWVGLRYALADLGAPPETVPRAVVADLPSALQAIDRATKEERLSRSQAVAAGNEMRHLEVRKLLFEMPVERLRDVTRDRLRTAPLTDRGINTVQAVLSPCWNLEHVPGLGPTTATQIRGAAQTVRQMLYDDMPVRLQVENPTKEATELLRLLGAWDSARKITNATEDLDRAAALMPLESALSSTASHIAVFPVNSEVSGFLEAVELVGRRAQTFHESEASRLTLDPWEDFLARPSDYFAMLSELDLMPENEEKTQGDLPSEVVEAVRSLELNTQYLSASLRGYQSFGARFALVQRKVIIGDEMGLGKTVEALAVLAHLRAEGSHHSLVVCPASLVTNWVREIQSKSHLQPHRVHGRDLFSALTNWLRNGGVAVTTFEALSYIDVAFSRPELFSMPQPLEDLGCVVVDEAHFIKNPEAQRSQRSASFIRRAEHAVLLTGTPMENRIDEFRNLVGYLRPDLVVDSNELTPHRFHRQVAPAYLRRNQEDVLMELPDLIEVDDWLPMSPQDESSYRRAVASGNFMAMRQAAMSSGEKSEKLQRLLEIVEEAGANGHRVIVFSHFRDTLDKVASALPSNVFGPLTGSVPAAARQVLVDNFSKAAEGAVLVAQIIAGGVGLNIQAASVVVICEPQLKPTSEWQAIARAHRMGQLDTVQVHRLLSEASIDERIVDMLARKRALFEEFARVSVTAESAPEAFDVSEAHLARDIIAAERERIFGKQSINAPGKGVDA